MRLWSVLFCVTGCLLCLVCSQRQNVHKRSIDDFNKNSNDIAAVTLHSEGRGLWDRFGSIFRSVSDYFGFSKTPPERKSRGSSVVRRPEMLPFQLQNVKNRRSGLEAPNGYPDQYNQFPESQSRILSQKPNIQRQRNPLEVSHKLEPPSFRGDEPTLRFDKVSHRHPPIPAKSNFMVVHVKDGNEQGPSRKPSKSNLNQQQPFEIAKVESREPLVSVYNKGIPTTKKSPPKAIQKLQAASSPVHSKFSLDKYSKAKEDPYWNDPIITNNKDSNSFVVTSSFSHGKKESVPTSGNFAGSTYQDRKQSINHNRKHVSQIMNSNPQDKSYAPQKKKAASSQIWSTAFNVNQNEDENNPNLVRKQRYHNHYERDARDTLKTQETDMNPFFAAMPHETLPSRRNEKRKGLIGSMTNFASNFFSNLLPKTATTSSPYPGNSLNPPPPQAFHSLASSNHESIEKRSPQIHHQPPPQLQKLGSSNRNRFAPSPLQGSMKVDSFQPIFVPSPSLDKQLPHDAMKPMIIPQKRHALTTAAPAAPQLIDFF